MDAALIESLALIVLIGFLSWIFTRFDWFSLVTPAAWKPQPA